jgi:hypothetical protein
VVCLVNVSVAPRTVRPVTEFVDVRTGGVYCDLFEGAVPTVEGGTLSIEFAAHQVRWLAESPVAVQTVPATLSPL